MMNINELYVKQIKDSLAKGNATVLVGAGFSIICHKGF